MRYLDLFPSEQQLRDEVWPQVASAAEPEFASADAFEAFMVRALYAPAYAPDAPETLLEAFRTLDAERKGYLTEEAAVRALTSGPHPFREKELDDFFRAAKDPDTGLVNYEHYVG